jgi:hypothetical protein
MSSESDLLYRTDRWPTRASSRPPESYAPAKAGSKWVADGGSIFTTAFTAEHPKLPATSAFSGASSLRFYFQSATPSAI